MPLHAAAEDAAPTLTAAAVGVRMLGMREVVRFAPEHLAGVLRLCVAEGWPSLPGNPERALRALTAPGVITVVAVEEHDVVGFAQMFSDGEIQAFLATLAVDGLRRGQGIGRALVTEALLLSGVERVDLLSEEESVGFYRSFPHFAKPGFRLYPFHEPGEH
jgi:ribosomal protein S18 acetylase RimI-like enzyme